MLFICTIFLGNLPKKIKYANILYTKWTDEEEIFYQLISIIGAVSLNSSSKSSNSCKFLFLLEIFESFVKLS